MAETDISGRFITTKWEEKTSFGYKLSLSRQTLQTLLSTFRVTPHFCPFMLGEPDYWAPLDMQRRNKEGIIEGIGKSYNETL